MFICCHPVLSAEARVALTLKTLCGFSVAEIAKAFVAQDETIAQRLVRAKIKITESQLKFEVPAGDELSVYHLQAGIASCHALAESFEATDWKQILSYYDLLFIKTNSPVVALNRAVALALANEIDAGLAELNRLKSNATLVKYYLYPAALAELYRRKDDHTAALKHYKKALHLVKTDPEKKLIQKRIESCYRQLQPK